MLEEMGVDKEKRGCRKYLSEVYTRQKSSLHHMHRRKCHEI